MPGGLQSKTLVAQDRVHVCVTCSLAPSLTVCRLLGGGNEGSKLIQMWTS